MADLMIHKYLDEMVRNKASDMYLTIGAPCSMRNPNNEIIKTNTPPLQNHDIEHLIDELLVPEEQTQFFTDLEFNKSISTPNEDRFRLNFFHQQHEHGIVIRHIKTEIPSAKALDLPKQYTEAIMQKRGLIIIASPTGSGKSTSMAAMLEHRNENSTGHILTIEDPIEFVHTHKSCIFTQREVGSDTLSLHNALRNVIRQRADVVAIGEIRDRETMEYALRFAETGHLCIATLHSTNAAQAIDRIINLFPEESRLSTLHTISQHLKAIFSQKLITNLKGQNMLIVDILRNEGLIKKLISKNQLSELRETQERSKDLGMQTFDQSLLTLFKNEQISYETALAEADNANSLKVQINQSDPNQNQQKLIIPKATNPDEF